MRRPFGLLASTVVLLSVVAGLLLMHGFEAASPEALVSHAVHLDEERIAVSLAVGWCVFVGALAASFAVGLLSVGLLADPFWRLVGGLTSVLAPVLRGPPSGFSYERCVIRV